PWNLVSLMGPGLSRSELASRLYDREVFDGATFGDLLAAGGPTVHINATDLTEGNRFTFGPGGFAVICSDIETFPISAAVAASAALPGLLSPLTLRNYAGRCGFEPPPWWVEALETRRSDPRRYRAARSALPYLDSEQKRYIHLVDGGISDNLGLRVPLDRISAVGNIEELRKLSGAARPDRLVIIVVNAENESDPTIDLRAAAPGLAASMGLVSGAQIRHYNFETLQLAETAMEEWARDLSLPGHPVTAHLVEVSFDLLGEEDERRFFKRMPTSLRLRDDQVDALRAVGRRLLRESPEFQELLEELR
ncbi:MAG: patatin-like phospholipase family protein, partial [Proteobacteria bacterium]|nr:patatin-like phospholipase family protein [Pseudomonadota bacterium]